MGRNAGIVIIGDEILSGKVRDENGPFLIEQLRGLGVPLRRLEVVPDEVEEIAATLNRVRASCDWVFTSGGVGPTPDDLTFDAVAAAFGVGLREDAELARIIREFYGDELRPAHLRMARVPSNTELLHQPGIPWPVVRCENIHVLPGFPEILRRKFLAMKELFRLGPFHLRRVLTGTDEGILAEFMDEIAAAHPGVALGSYPSYGPTGLQVLVTVEGREEVVVERAKERLLELLGPEGVLSAE